MKRLIIMGAILAGVAVCVLLACTSVSTMAKDGPKKMVITVNAETGKVIVTDEEGKLAEQLDCRELGKFYQGKGRLEYVGTILYSHSSPGCIVFTDGLGFFHRICWP